jgi:hypothetical protein
MRREYAVSIAFAFLLTFFPAMAFAQHQHDHGGASTQPGNQSAPAQSKGSAQSMTIDGLKLTFEVMDMSAHMSMPGMKGNSMTAMDHSQTHFLMVTVQDTTSKEIISDAEVTATILTPSGRKETARLDWSGDHYGKGFSPQEKGVYQVQLQIKSGGMEREAKFSYSL